MYSNFVVTLRSLLLFAALVSAPQAWAYQSLGGIWSNAQATFYVDIPGADGLWNTAFEGAMAEWNDASAFEYFIVRGVYADPCRNDDGRNGVGFEQSYCGSVWGSTTLAITQSRYLNAALVETDIAFNGTLAWNVYSGPLLADIEDFRRVAVHELGHALGLGHENRVPSVMSSFAGSIERPQPDDVRGVAAIYGADFGAPGTGTFQDVPPSYWAFTSIEQLAAAGITQGCGNSNYCPGNSVTRGQMAVFLERGIRGGSYQVDPGVGDIFVDVPADYWASGWIELLYMDGITSGCSNDGYCPSRPTTRAEMAIFLLKAKYGKNYAPPDPIGEFDDVPVSHWAAGWIEQLAVDGITRGCGHGNYCPGRYVTRAEMAVFMVRTFGL